MLCKVSALPAENLQADPPSKVLAVSCILSQDELSSRFRQQGMDDL